MNRDIEEIQIASLFDCEPSDFYTRPNLNRFDHWLGFSISFEYFDRLRQPKNKKYLPIIAEAIRMHAQALPEQERHKRQEQFDTFRGTHRRNLDEAEWDYMVACMGRWIDLCVDPPDNTAGVPTRAWIEEREVEPLCPQGEAGTAKESRMSNLRVVTPNEIKCAVQVDVQGKQEIKARNTFTLANEFCQRHNIDFDEIYKFLEEAYLCGQQDEREELTRARDYERSKIASKLQYLAEAIDQNAPRRYLNPGITVDDL